MAHHEFHMPVSEAQVRALRVNDTVTLQRTLYGIRDATQIHMFDRGRHDALRPERARRDPHRAQREEGGAERSSSRPATRRSASAPPRPTAWSASRGR